jgi:Putative outer membrane beta-barrel porin, MtrB/PioB
MKTNQDCTALRASVIAVRGALITLAMLPAAYAADTAAPDAAVTELTQPKNTVEVGIGDVSDNSYKFGEFNGLQKKGAYGIFNFDLRGGAYDSDSDATRWRFNGTDLGLDTRNLSGEYGEQGRFRVDFGYDSLRRNRSDSYQTPYLGAGTNNLTLPGNWLAPLLPRVNATAPAAGAGGGANARGLSTDLATSSALINGVLTAPTAAQLAQSATIIAADVPAFQNVNLSTKRERYDAGFSYNLTRQLEFKAGFTHEDKDGLKPLSTVSRYTNGDLAAVIPDLISQSTEQYNLGLNYKDGKSFLQAAYYGSVFKNDVKSMSWANWAVPGAMQTMTSPPDNQYHQFKLTGGYKFSPATKLVMDGSYARNTQNESFVTDATMPLVPTTSLSGLVVTKAFDMKLTSKASKDLNVAAGYKYNDRDNRTPVNTYGYYDAGELGASGNTNAAFSSALGLPAGVLRSNANINANRPYSKKVNLLNLDADYRLAKGQSLNGGYEWQKIDRSCPGSWIDCADAATTKENTLRAEWRTRLGEDVNAKLGYAYSERKISAYNENAFLALVPMANVVPVGATASAYATMLALGVNGYGPLAGLPATALTGNQAFFFANNNALANALYGNQNRISELPGMRRLNMADRNRDKLRSSINWQASEKFSLAGGLDFNKDDYANSVYGLQNAKSWAFNLDGSFAVSDDFSISLFYTFEDMRSRSAGNTYTANSTAANVNGFTAIQGGCFATIALRNANNKLDPCLNWTTDMTDKIDTIGLALTQKGLMSGKLDLTAKLVYTDAKSDISGAGGNYANNPLAVTGAPAGTIAAFYIPFANLPTVSTKTTELRLSGQYEFDKNSSARVGYVYARLKSSDWAYQGMQYGGLAGVLPSNEQSPNYNLHVIGVSYNYRFR